MTASNPDAPLTAAGQVIADLAQQHGVTYVRTRYDALADTFTRLSDDEVETDATEKLLIALMRRRIIDGKRDFKHTCFA